jgi:hypothetical protein
MSKKQTVELRPSKIRREPPAPAAQKLTVLPDSPNRDTWTVVIGVLLFALAINIIIFWTSDFTSH